MNRKIQTFLAAALLALALLPGLAGAADYRGSHRGYAYDNRYQHGHYYPYRGTRFRAVPPGGVHINFRGSPYLFHGGVWYRPWGSRFVVIAPPIGIGIRVLPAYYSTVWFGGVPYYYADDTYYQWRAAQQEYVVTAPPTGVQSAAPAPDSYSETYAYPKNGQSEEVQASDRFECHSWAASQSGFDPTQPSGGVPASDAADRRADYQRAERACLEGRGYSVN